MIIKKLMKSYEVDLFYNLTFKKNCISSSTEC